MALVLEWQWNCLMMCTSFKLPIWYTASQLTIRLSQDSYFGVAQKDSLNPLSMTQKMKFTLILFKLQPIFSLIYLDTLMSKIEIRLENMQQMSKLRSLFPKKSLLRQMIRKNREDRPHRKIYWMMMINRSVSSPLSWAILIFHPRLRSKLLNLRRMTQLTSTLTL